MTEECERLLAALGDPDLRRVAVLRMDGYSVDEVADRVGCAPRSVKRKLQLIRTIWEREAGDGRT
jgi:DNA-directed RNA polymerase specialized sigma24 family protein